MIGTPGCAAGRVRGQHREQRDGDESPRNGAHQRPASPAEYAPAGMPEPARRSRVTSLDVARRRDYTTVVRRGGPQIASPSDR